MTDIVTLLTENITFDEIRLAGARLMQQSRRPPGSSGPPKIQYAIMPQTYKFADLNLKDSYLFTIGPKFMFQLFVMPDQQAFERIEQVFGDADEVSVDTSLFTWNLGAHRLTVDTSKDTEHTLVKIFTPNILNESWAGVS